MEIQQQSIWDNMPKLQLQISYSQDKLSTANNSVVEAQEVSSLNCTPVMNDRKLNVQRKYLSGYLTTKQLVVHQILGFTLIWSIYGAAYYTFNLSNSYSILKHTFSLLGSWDSDCNPKGWYWFSAGMCLSFFVEVPIVMYIYQRLKLVNGKLAKWNASFWMVGVSAQFLVGCCPSTNSLIFGNVKFEDVHNVLAAITFICLLIGAPLNGALVGYDRRNSCTKIGKKNLFDHRFTDTCMAVILLSMSVSVFICVLGQMIDLLEIKSVPSPVWEFSLWENVIIFTLYLYLIWFPFTLPNRCDNVVSQQLIM
ncbi:DUF998_domain-containing protein [Hexamita inflata]|uniref:DUF998 domain-containing protein n=1 Tax=Hexamita inflata TaxID=28002 RepID=A0AA86PQ80_9EUKA|nr:DUF998 domain-containing protein [Hexamita inflata]